MKQEYDFSRGERGKLFRENARLDLPVYPDEDVQRYVQERARSKGMEVARLVNEMLRQDIERIEAVKQEARQDRAWSSYPCHGVVDGHVPTKRA